MAINISTTLMPKKDFGDILRKMKEPRKQPANTENKIKTSCKGASSNPIPMRSIRIFRGGSVRTYVNADMTHDTNKTKQDKRFTKQGDALSESRRFAIFFLLFNLCDIEQKNSDDGHNHINREQDAPA